MTGYKDPIYQRNRKIILAGEPMCHWCGKAKATQADHVIELDRGGTHDIDNLVPSCASCNASRGARHVNRKTAQRIQNRNIALARRKRCEQCLSEFVPDWRNEARGGGKYCSIECRNQANRKPSTWYIAKWECRICGQPMVVGPIKVTNRRPKKRSTCSNKCSTTYVSTTAYHQSYERLGIALPDTAPTLRPDTWSIRYMNDDPQPNDPEFLSNFENSTPSPSPVNPPGGLNMDESGLDLADDAHMGRIEPRLVVEADRISDCPPALLEFAKRYLGKELMGWQVEALADQLSGWESGSFRFREALISTARQNGKSVALQALIGWWLTDEARRRKEPQNVLLVANKIDRSMPMFRQLAAILEESFGANVRWANGSQSVTMPDGSVFKIAAAKDNHHGGTYDLIVVDELWDIAPAVIFDALRPSMIARRNPLMSMWSTAGDESSTTMLRLREQAMAAIDRGIRGNLYFAEWSIPPGVDPSDRRYWRWANPALGTTITLDALEAMADGGDRAAFLRAHLNLWVSAAKSWIGHGAWAALKIDQPMPPGGILAVDSSLDDSRYVGVRAVPIPEGVQVYVEFVVESEPDMWIEIRRVMKDPNVQLTITPGLELHTPFDLKRRTTTFGYGELTKYTDLIRKAITERRIWHNGSVALADHVNRAVLVKTNASTVVSSQKSPGPIELCRCMIVAAALASRPTVKMRPAFASS